MQDGFSRNSLSVGQVLGKCPSVLSGKPFKRAADQNLLGEFAAIRRLMKVRRFQAEMLLIASSQDQAKCIDNCRLAVVLANKSGKA